MEKSSNPFLTATIGKLNSIAAIDSTQKEWALGLQRPMVVVFDATTYANILATIL